MQESSNIGKWIAVASVVLGVSLMISACFIQRGYVTSKDLSNQNIGSVTGLAEKSVESDKAKWSVQISRPTIGKVEETVKNIQEDEKRLRSLLTQAGIKDAIVSVQPANIQSTEGAYSNQVIVIETANVMALSTLSERAITEFNKDNAYLSTNSIEYYYSGLTELQKQLTKQAVEDARSQAKDVFGLVEPRIQSIGYPQLSVTPENASMYYGNADTSSIKKKVTMSTSVSFFLK